jgi:hypothetical protein
MPEANSMDHEEREGNKVEMVTDIVADPNMRKKIEKEKDDVSAAKREKASYKTCILVVRRSTPAYRSLCRC